MKRTVCLVLALLLAVLSGCGSGGKNADATESPATESYPPMTGIHHVEIEVEDFGTISVELDGDTAPITVGNFIGLAESGFYDGLTFHRVVSDFVIQGGDPEGTGYGGSPNTIKGEFSKNGVENSISHLRGVISMARSDISYDSASSQFFIVHQDSVFLDGAYAAFGHVTSGMEVVDRICEETPVQDEKGTVYKVDQPVIKSIKVID
jgi:peptidyl-prolyl cis-trans isomerase B (cyclophilin B)